MALLLVVLTSVLALAVGGFLRLEGTRSRVVITFELGKFADWMGATWEAAKEYFSQTFHKGHRGETHGPTS
jgi:hypothetical protein